jgi:thioredoxin 1
MKIITNILIILQILILPVSVFSEIRNNTKSCKVTFIELGSVNCVPCKMMQPVMKKVEEKYKNQVNVVFYDVWTKKDAPMAEKHKINVIPTQVFLDADGKEYFRHEGFFAFEELEKILKQKGVK